MVSEVKVYQFHHGTQGGLDVIETIKCKIHVKSHFGPVWAGCAVKPFKEHHYHCIQYLGQWWEVRQNTYSDGTTHWALKLPCKSTMTSMGFKQ